MRNILKMFLLLLLLYSSVYSQLTLTSAYNPIPGDVGKYFYCDTTGIMPGDSGINQNWNFSNLLVNDSSISNYVDPVNTPYFFSFPLSNVASLNAGQSLYSYYKTSSGMYEYMGYAYTGFLETLSNTEVLMQYPFTYSSLYNDTYSGSGTLSGIQFNVTGTFSRSGDATGTVNLPFGTYSNALRTKSIQTETDSAIGFPYVINISSVEYSWYVNILKFPVLTIYYYTLIENGDTTIGKDVYYCNSQLVEISQNGNSIPAIFKLYQNYPNPFNPVTKIKFSLPSVGQRHAFDLRLVIYDVLGREIVTLVNEQLTPGTYEVEWNAAIYPSGIYFYKITTSKFTETKKMILVK
jgi:Secretion system C-terminal sorting domain